MKDRAALAALILTIMVGALALGGIAIVTLYHIERDRWSVRLADAAGAEAQTLAALPSSAGDLARAPPRPPVARAADHRMVIGRLEGDAVVVAEEAPAGGSGSAASRAAPDAGLAATMRRALAGESGVTTFEDAGGRRQLAAFVPVAGQELGVVAFLPVDAIRAPFTEAGKTALLFGLPLLLLAALLSALIGRAILRRGEISRARSSDVVERMRTGIIVVRPAGDDFLITDINGAGERIQGIRRQNVVGRSLREAVPSMRSTQFLDTLRRVARTGAAEHLPAAPAGEDGGSLWRELSFHRLPDGDLVIAADDVTDRRRAEDALRESEARWRSIMEMHEQAIVILDPRLDIRFVNRAAETLFARSSHDLIGAPFGYPLVPGELAEIEILHPHHGIAYAEMRMIPMRWGGQEQYLVFLRDVSTHRRTEGDLRKLFQAIEQSPVSVVITDVEGRIEYVNPKFSETTGYTYAEVVGKNPRVLKSEHTPAHEYQALWQTISAGQVWHGEFYNRRKNGEFFWELAAIAPVRDQRGNITHYVAVKEDISERKATEERLRHSQKMETIGQLTGGLAHDFNNLLAIIIGNLQLLEERGDIDPESRELIADALWSAERGAQLTHRLLAFARRQRLNPKRTDLNGVVGEMTDLLRRTIGDKVRIVENFAPELWETMVDRGQLESSLLNLVVNARDAMAGGGVLTISTGNIRLPPNPASTADDTPPGDYVLLDVADTGCGMPPEVLERIFEPFFTTKKLGEGSGLGLSMVYGFVRQSGGQILVDSTPGEGTSVRLCLPRARAGDLDGETMPPDCDAAEGGRQVILVVEDDPEARTMAATILRNQDYVVAEAADAASALNGLQTLSRLDLLFTNVSLPNGRNGFELADAVVRLRPHTKVLFASGHASGTLAAESRWSGEVDLLVKPYRHEQLTMRIRTQLERPLDTDTATRPAAAATTAGGGPPPPWYPAGSEEPPVGVDLRQSPPSGTTG